VCSPRDKSILVRQAKSKALADEIRAYKVGHPDMSNRAIALEMGCALDTVNRAFRE
jgi:hypothetical protein